MKNKKIMIIIGVVVILVIVAVIITVIVVNKNKSGNQELYKLINKNSELPVEYMSKNSNIDTSEYEVLNNFMSDDYSNEDIQFSYYGYPNDESEYYLGRITLLTSKYNILGVKVGDKKEEAISKISKYGFELQDENIISATLKYKDFEILLSFFGEDVTQIKLEADSKYLGNRIY